MTKRNNASSSRKVTEFAQFDTQLNFPESTLFEVYKSIMTANINPFSGKTYEIAADLSEPLIIENFDPTKDSIQLPANPDSEVIPQFSFSDRYILTEINGDTAISTMIFAVNVSRSLCLQAYLQII